MPHIILVRVTYHVSKLMILLSLTSLYLLFHQCFYTASLPSPVILLSILYSKTRLWRAFATPTAPKYLLPLQVSHWAYCCDHPLPPALTNKFSEQSPLTETTSSPLAQPKTLFPSWQWPPRHSSQALLSAGSWRISIPGGTPKITSFLPKIKMRLYVSGKPYLIFDENWCYFLHMHLAAV